MRVIVYQPIFYPVSFTVNKIDYSVKSVINHCTRPIWRGLPETNHFVCELDNGEIVNLVETIVTHTWEVFGLPEYYNKMRTP